MREIGCRGQQPSYDREVEERHARSLRTTKGIIMTKLPKNYRAAAEKVGEGVRAPLEALALVKEVAFAKFDETVSVDFRLGIDTRQADQQLRGTVSLPNGSGKTVRVAVFAEGEAARAAEEAGADNRGHRRADRSDPGGRVQLRCRRGHARPDGQGGSPRQDPRPARPYAEPEAGHRHQRCGEGHHGAQGRSCGVPRRPLPASRTSSSAR